MSDRTSHRVADRTDEHEGHAADETDDEREAYGRPLTSISSSATLCASDDEEGYFSRYKTKESIDVPAAIAENPSGTDQTGSSHFSHPTSPGRPQEREDAPPPIHGPDVIAYLDPASAGGGGPLKRITTQQRERAEAEARERAERAHRQVVDPEEGSSGILSRFGLGSARRRRPSATLDHHEEEDEQERGSRFVPNLPTSWSSNTLAASASEDGSGEQTPGVDDKKIRVLDIEEQPVEYVYPDGGYGWVVVVCCMVLAGCTLGWVFFVWNEVRKLTADKE